jgi:hypothetical protein
MRETAGKGAPAGRCRPSGVSPQSRSLSVPRITDELVPRAARRSSFAYRGTLRKRAGHSSALWLGKGLQTRSRPIIAACRQPHRAARAQFGRDSLPRSGCWPASWGSPPRATATTQRPNNSRRRHKPRSRLLPVRRPHRPFRAAICRSTNRWAATRSRATSARRTRIWPSGSAASRRFPPHRLTPIGRPRHARSLPRSTRRAANSPPGRSGTAGGRISCSTT